MQLWVGTAAEAVDGLVSMGEIAAARDDIVYGSFRAGIKVTTVPGTCGAFFWYRNNTEEIDMKYLSAAVNETSQPLFLILQTQQAEDAGYNAAGTGTFDIAQLQVSGGMPGEEFHEYRFDWTVGKVSFYVDGKWLRDIDWTYPFAPGHLSLNHWTNGNEYWSRGPPEQRAALTISYVKAYFNSSDAETQSVFERGCRDMRDVCEIPEQDVPPDGNAARTTFLGNMTMCGEEGAQEGGSSGSGANGVGSILGNATALAALYYIVAVLQGLV